MLLSLNLMLIILIVTPSNRPYAVLAISAKLRIETIRRRPPNITCTENAHAMRVDLITNGYIAIVTIDPKRTYIYNNDSNEPR